MVGTYAASMIVSIFVFALLIIAHKVLLGIWAYLDAKERGISGDVGWGFVVALVPVYIGLIIYVAVRPGEARSVCPACKRVNAKDARFCSNCGASMEPAALSVNQPKRSRRVLVAFFICIGAAVLLLVTMIATSVAFSMRFVDRVLPRMNDYFHEWRIDPNMPGFRFDFHVGDGNNT